LLLEHEADFDEGGDAGSAFEMADVAFYGGDSEGFAAGFVGEDSVDAFEFDGIADRGSCLS